MTSPTKDFSEILTTIRLKGKTGGFSFTSSIMISKITNVPWTKRKI